MNLLALCSSLTGEVQREVLISSPWDPLIRHMEVAQRGTKGSSDWTLGSISLPGGWSDTGTGLLERWLRPQACLRGIWTTCSVLKWMEALQAVGVDDHYRFLSTKISIFLFLILTAVVPSPEYS